MYEVRIINGLHRGVSLPLEDSDIYIGSSLESDIALVDPGIAEKHIHIETSDKLPPMCWYLNILDENTKNAKGKKIKGQIIAKLNHRVNIGGIWITFCNESDPWVFNTEVTPEKPTETVKKARSPGLMMKLYFLFAGVMIGLVALSHAGANKRPKIATVDPALFAPEYDLNYGLNVDEPHLDSTYTNSSETEHASTFRKMLRERNLDAVDLITDGPTWTLIGNLEPYEAEKLARMLTRFNKQYPNQLELIDQTSIVEQELPFKIVRVVSGPMGHIEVADGYKIYVGNKYQGFKLAGITKEKILFTGKSSLEIDW